MSMGPLDKFDQYRLQAMPVAGGDDVDRLLQLLAARYSHQQEALQLYRPLPTQLEFHASWATERIVRGGNRGGKSLCCFAEIASAATKTPIIGPDDKPLPFKYPADRPMTIWVIGYGERHIASPIFRLLFLPGAFKIVRDLQTGKWRAWRPWDPADKAREKECKPSPPFIPPRLIDPKGWGWKSKSERIFTVCRLKDGTEIYAFTSNAEPKQGDPVDLLHIDEDILYPKHVAEWQARLSDTKGRLTWAAFPHGKNHALVDMSARAEQQRHLPKPDVHEIVLKFSENPYMDPEEVRKRRAGWSEEEVRARDFGEFITDTVQMYPNFSKYIHGIQIDPPDNSEREHKIHTILRNNGWQPPRHWSRYLVLDPGHTRAAVLFATVPPPELGDFVVLYDELYLAKHDARQLALKVRDKAQGNVFEAFIIDYRASRRTPEGFGKTIRQQYTDAFVEVGLQCVRAGSGFLPSSDDKAGGIGLVRNMLTIRGDGTARLMVCLATLPNFLEEIKKYRKKVVQDEIRDEPVDADNHLMDCLRYLAAYDPRYVEPDLSAAQPSPAFLAWKRMFRKEAEDSSIYMGAGAA